MRLWHGTLLGVSYALRTSGVALSFVPERLRITPALHKGHIRTSPQHPSFHPIPRSPFPRSPVYTLGASVHDTVGARLNE